MTRIDFMALLLFSLFCGTINADKLPNDIRWVTQSKEYANLCKQTYQHAQSVVVPKLKRAKGNLAIVMDLDETVLDNSKYQVERSELNLGLTLDLPISFDVKLPLEQSIRSVPLSILIVSLDHSKDSSDFEKEISKNELFLSEVKLLDESTT